VSFGKGARRSHPSKLLRAVPAHLHPRIAALLASSLPSAADLLAYVPPRKDQGQSGSCTAGSISGGTSTALRRAGTPLPWEPSPREIYAATRAEERAIMTPVSLPLPPLQDVGAELADVITVLGTLGVCPQAVPTTPDGRNYDIWTANDGPATPNVNNEPDAAQLEAAATTLVTGAYRIDNGAPTASDQAAAAIVAGFPLYAGFFVDSAFEALGPNGVAGPPNENDPNGGGHAVFLAGYRTNAAGAREWLLVNSWGTGWANDGTVWCSTAWLAAAWETWILDVAVSTRAVA